MNIYESVEGSPRPAVRGAECHCGQESPLSSVDQFYCCVCRWGHCHSIDPALQGPPVPFPRHLKSVPRLFCLDPCACSAHTAKVVCGGKLESESVFSRSQVLVFSGSWSPRLKRQILHISWTYLLGESTQLMSWSIPTSRQESVWAWLLLSLPCVTF